MITAPFFWHMVLIACGMFVFEIACYGAFLIVKALWLDFYRARSWRRWHRQRMEHWR